MCKDVALGLRLHEKGGKQHEMPCHHNLDDYLHAYINGAGLSTGAKGLLFRTAIPHTEQLTDRSMSPGRRITG